jgi:hypothetical protein
MIVRRNEIIYMTFRPTWEIHVSQSRPMFTSSQGLTPSSRTSNLQISWKLYVLQETKIVVRKGLSYTFISDTPANMVKW